MASVAVHRLKKSFPPSGGARADPLEVLRDINIDIADGEFVSFFGPNGCGKTTFLTLVSGQLQPDSGTVTIDGAPPETARVGFIFQNYREALYPWLRNVDNVAFPLAVQGVQKRERRARARDLVRNLSLDIPLGGYPYQLSGGQQQLLSIARAHIFGADVLLMDEPFASLDYSTRFFARDRVQQIWMKTETTTLLVSHSIDEAIYLADRLILFRSYCKTLCVPFSHEPISHDRSVLQRVGETPRNSCRFARSTIAIGDDD